MTIRSLVYCVLIGSSISGSALAECVFPSAPEFVSAGPVPTKAEVERAQQSMKEYQQQYVSHSHCLHAELSARVQLPQSDPNFLDHKQVKAALDAKAQANRVPYEQAFIRYNEFLTRGTALASSRPVAAALVAPPPTQLQSAGTTVTTSSGNTLKSACWNYNLTATELLNCGACEKQYADMLPQLNQLAAYKKQTQLNAFLADCPRAGR